MKTAFVETENYRRLSDLATHLRGLDDEEPRLGVVSGRTGLGKTWAVHHYFIQNRRKHNYTYLRGLDVWSPSAFLRAVAGELGCHPWRERASCFAEVRNKLVETGGHLILDEADYFAADKHLLNTIRDLHDVIPGSIILVGEEELPGKLGTVKHFWGRVAKKVKFAALTAGDVAFIAHALCEVPGADGKMDPLVLAKEQAQQISGDTQGAFRAVKKTLRKLEADMHTNELAAATPRLVTEALHSIKRAA
jgi:DNA transposition AAA+ family ATPase